MYGLTKIALNAQKAREMAEQAGVVPAGNWKWALRNLRNDRGELLEGRELAEAKLELGKTPNNVRQRMESLSRKTGHQYEVGGVIENAKHQTESRELRKQMGISERFENNPLVLQDMRNRMRNASDEEAKDALLEKFPGASADALTPEFLRTYRKDLQSTKGLSEWESDIYRIGNNDSVDMSDQLNRTDITHLIHTHPHAESFKYKRPTESGSLGNLQKQEYERISAKDHRKVTPSGQVAFEKGYGADMDMGALEDLREMNLNTNFNILDPVYGNEGVHKLRPQGLRSVFFKNEGQR